MTAERRVVVRARDGLHARPCAALSARVRRSRSRVTATVGDRSADVASVLALMLLEAAQGAEVRLSAEGTDAEEVLGDLARILEEENG